MDNLDNIYITDASSITGIKRTNQTQVDLLFGKGNVTNDIWIFLC